MLDEVRKYLAPSFGAILLISSFCGCSLFPNDPKPEPIPDPDPINIILVEDGVPVLANSGDDTASIFVGSFIVPKTGVYEIEQYTKLSGDRELHEDFFLTLNNNTSVQDEIVRDIPGFFGILWRFAGAWELREGDQVDITLNHGWLKEKGNYDGINRVKAFEYRIVFVSEQL